MFGNKKPLIGKDQTHRVWWPKINRKQMMAIKAATGLFNGVERITPEFEELIIKAAGKGHLKFEEIVNDPQRNGRGDSFKGWIHVYFDVEGKYIFNGVDQWGKKCMHFTNHVMYGDKDRKRFNEEPGRTHMFPILAKLGIPTFSAKFHTDWLKSFLALQ